MSLPIYLFHQGTNCKAYEFLGCHFGEKDGKQGAYFRTWAPNAKKVFLVGDFNNFDVDSALEMQKISDGGVYEVFLEGVAEFDAYKFLIETKDNRKILKADPYAFHSETNGKTASKAYNIDREFAFNDKKWQKYNQKDIHSRPMNIYEVHLNSFKRNEADEYLTYRELADILVPYVLEMGYTHIELLPLTEYPFDGSWGYQVTGFFSLTSRFGTSEDFVYFVDKFHSVGIGVLLDWVPAHFAKDAFGLYEFDGQPLYECQGWDRMENKGWGTRVFDFARNEVQSFLISSAMFWLDKYHIDGLRVDAVASMIYLDYGKKPGEWIPNIHGENKNLEAIEFIKKLNSQIKSVFPDKLIIAEESTAYPYITKPVNEGGLGFDFKWNMGWMNDMCEYVKVDSFFRKHHHNKITFSFMYCFSEKFILPISHDEVVHGKKSLLDKMSGTYEEKFGNMRTFLAYMIAHPGKKLLFMGSEFGQFREWDYKGELEFFMLDYPLHQKLHNFTKKLNHFYLKNKELYEIDTSYEGLYFNSADDNEQNIIAFTRKAKNGQEMFIVINFAPVLRENYQIGTSNGEYKLAFNTDLEEFGGTDIKLKQKLKTNPKPMHGFDSSLTLTLPPLSVLFYKKVRTKKIKES